MVIIKPFKGFTPKSDLADKISSPPYDVMNIEEARKLADGNELSFLHVVKAEINFPPNADISKADVNNKAKDKLEELISSQNLVQDKTSCLYIYQQAIGKHKQIGLVAGFSCDEYDKNIVKKHEFTRPDKEKDRTDHINTLGVNSGPIFLTYKSNSEINSIIDKIITDTPNIEFMAEDNVLHTLWKVLDSKDIDNLVNRFANIPSIYIADGHHRTAAALNTQKMRAAENQKHTGQEDYNFFLGVVFPDKQLKILDYNRCIKDLNSLSPDQIIDKIKDKFVIDGIDNLSDPEKAKPKNRGQFAMLLEDKWYRLTIKAAFWPQEDPVESLDVSILQNTILDPILGIKDPRTDTRIDFIGGSRGLKELERRCNLDCKIAFALFPTGIDQLIAIADANEVMPPKSTWFEPKLRSGMVVKSI
jgi:uncharacterized protein (DUF1015 family)